MSKPLRLLIVGSLLILCLTFLAKHKISSDLGFTTSKVSLYQMDSDEQNTEYRKLVASRFQDAPLYIGFSLVAGLWICYFLFKPPTT